MKKIVVFMLTLMLLGTTFAYQPTKQDDALLNVLNSSFGQQLKKDSSKASLYVNTLDALSVAYRTKDSSGRFSYIFDSLSDYIKTNILGVTGAIALPQLIPTPASVTPKLNSPITLRGEGVNITDKFYLPAGFYKVHSMHFGDSNFIAHLLDEEGDNVAYLVNEIGETDQIATFKIDKAGNYFIEVDADADWTFDISDNSPKPSESTDMIWFPLVLKGQNQAPTDFFLLKKGLYKFDSVSQGESNFIVHLDNEKGDTVGYLANGIGDVSETNVVKIEKDGYYLLNVDSEGTWSVTVSKM